MRAVMLEVPDELLAERRRRGLDRRDEVWAGVLHMVPPPASHHNLFADDLNAVLREAARRRHLRSITAIGVFDPDAGEHDYRVPDIVVARPEVITRRGVEGAAELVIEVLSPNDESRDKLPFYARAGVREAWLVHPVTRAFEVFALRGRRITAVKPRAGVVRSALGLELATIDGPRLRVRDGDVIADV